MTVTAAQIRGLVSDIPADKDLTQIILMARLAVEEYLPADTSVLSEGKLTMIELLLAAHYAVLSFEHGGLTHQQMGDASETYHDISTTATGLGSTRFGAQAIALDVTGALAVVSTGGLHAEFEVY